MSTSGTTPTTNNPKTLSGWVGHLLTLLLAGTAGGVGYGTVETRLSTLESRVDSLENQLLEEMREIKKDLINLRVQVTEVAGDVRWLKDKNK
tara:strand:+ start:29 stop:304 length:276 start_codon:yes stop_codon:yes gene_type:complete